MKLYPDYTYDRYAMHEWYDLTPEQARQVAQQECPKGYHVRDCPDPGRSCTFYSATPDSPSITRDDPSWSRLFGCYYHDTKTMRICFAKPSPLQP